MKQEWYIDLIYFSLDKQENKGKKKYNCITVYKHNLRIMTIYYLELSNLHLFLLVY